MHKKIQPKASPQTPPTLSWRRWPTWLMSLLLAVLAASVYLPILSHDFLDWDDNDTVQLNPDFDPNNPHADWGHYWTAPYLELYMPLTYMAWGVTSQFSQAPNPAGGGNVLSPGGFHALSLILHCTCSMLVFLVLRRLTCRKWAACLGAAVFAVHPLQVESVAWITSASIPLSAAFSLWAMWHFMRFDELRDGVQDELLHQKDPVPAPDSRIWLHYILGTFAFVLALLAKPSVVVVPLILAAIAIGMRRRSPRRLAIPLGIWVLLSVPIVLITTSAQSAWMIHVPPLHRPLVALDALGFCLAKLIWPAGLIPDYGRTPAWLFSHGLSVIAAIPVLFAVGVAGLWRKARWPAVSLAVFALALLPVLGLTPFSYQRFSTVADRYVYLAMLAPAIVVTSLLSWRFNRVSLAVIGGAVAILGVLTLNQQQYWRDTSALFLRTLAVNPQSLEADYALGKWYASHGDLTRAIEYDRAALRIRPHDGRVLYQMGNALLRLGRLDEAIEAYHLAVDAPVSRSASSSIEVQDSLPAENRANAFQNLGVAYIRAGNLDAAIASFGQAVQLDPNHPEAARNLAAAQAMRERQKKSPR